MKADQEKSVSSLPAAQTGRLRVLYPFVGDSVGGSHVSTVELIDALPRDRIEPVVLLHRTGPLMQYLRDRHVEFMQCPELPVAEANGSLERAVKVAFSLLRLVRFLRRNRIDIVHTNDWRMHVTWLFAARAAGAAHVWHQRTKWAPRRFVLPVRLASRIVVISEFCRRALPPSLQDRTEIIWNPVEVTDPPDTREARGAIRSELGLPAECRIVAFVGNFSDRKRPETFVEIASGLAPKQGPDVRFLMFGEAREPHATAVRRGARLAGVEDLLYIVGQKYPFHRWLAGCDVLVAPAVREAFGRSVVEAMLCNVPVVAADHGGHREIIRHGETGYLIPPDGTAAFVAHVWKCLADDTFNRKMTQQAHSDVAKRFSTRTHAESVLSVYQAISEKSRIRE